VYRDKSSATIYAAYVIFRKLPNVNNRPIGENSPNLVTLPMMQSYLRSLETTRKLYKFTTTYTVVKAAIAPQRLPEIFFFSKK
jgi:hypothetical protein